jgi:hypothetical protein
MPPVVTIVLKKIYYYKHDKYIEIEPENNDFRSPSHNIADKLVMGTHINNDDSLTFQEP